MHPRKHNKKTQFMTPKFTEFNKGSYCKLKNMHSFHIALWRLMQIQGKWRHKESKKLTMRKVNALSEREGTELSLKPSVYVKHRRGDCLFCWLIANTSLWGCAKICFIYFSVWILGLRALGSFLAFLQVMIDPLSRYGLKWWQCARSWRTGCY